MFGDWCWVVGRLKKGLCLVTVEFLGNGEEEGWV